MHVIFEMLKDVNEIVGPLLCQRAILPSEVKPVHNFLLGRIHLIVIFGLE